MRHRGSALAFLLALLAVLAGCFRPVPTPDVRATEAALAAIVQRTLTALAPTMMPLPTKRPTYTPRSSPTATSTTVPVEVPAGWETYVSITGDFTVVHPASWLVSDEGKEHVSFKPSRFSVFGVQIMRAPCNMLGSDTLDCLVGQMAEGLGSGSDQFRLANKGTWDDGVHQGYTAEAILYDTMYESYTYYVEVFLPLASGKMVSAYYFRVGVSGLTEREREVFQKAVASLRVAQKE